MTRKFITYQPIDRPAVEVLCDGEWCPGELTQWVQADDGAWSANVIYHRAGFNYSTRFAADHVRKDTVDRSRGRR